MPRFEPRPGPLTLSRRAETLEVPRPKTGSEPVYLLVNSTGLRLCGAGEWLVKKHGTKRRRAWKMFRLAIDTDTGHIVGSVSRRAVTASEDVGYAR